MTSPRVLIVEDSLELIQLFSRVLARSATPHLSTNTVASAIAALDLQQFPLVLLDKRLGSSNGLDVLTHIRAAPTHRHSRVIIVSGDVEETNNHTAPDNADGYLLKPVSVATLLDVVAAQLHAYDTSPHN